MSKKRKRKRRYVDLPSYDQIEQARKVLLVEIRQQFDTLRTMLRARARPDHVLGEVLLREVRNLSDRVLHVFEVHHAEIDALRREIVEVRAILNAPRKTFRERVKLWFSQLRGEVAWQRWAKRK